MNISVWWKYFKSRFSEAGSGHDAGRVETRGSVFIRYEKNIALDKTERHGSRKLFCGMPRQPGRTLTGFLSILQDSAPNNTPVESDDGKQECDPGNGKKTVRKFEDSPMRAVCTRGEGY